MQRRERFEWNAEIRELESQDHARWLRSMGHRGGGWEFAGGPGRCRTRLPRSRALERASDILGVRLTAAARVSTPINFPARIVRVMIAADRVRIVWGPRQTPSRLRRWPMLRNNGVILRFEFPNFRRFHSNLPCAGITNFVR